MKYKLESEIKTQIAIDKILKTFPDFANEWYINMRSKVKSASSAYNFVRKVRNFLEYISRDIQNMKPDEITMDACESYFISCQTRIDRNGMEIYSSYSHIRNIWYTLNSFLKFLVKNKYIENNYIEDIVIPKNNKQNNIKKKQINLTKNDLNKILNAAKNGSGYKGGLLGNRDVLIILLFMTTGIQKTAMSEINLEDINIYNKTLSINDRYDRFMVYDLNDQVIGYLNKYLEDREQLKTNKTNNALFLNKDGSRLGDDSIYNIVRNCSYKGIGKKLSPQKLRIAFCRILYNKTHDIEFVSKAVGHLNITTTQRYIDSKGGEKKKALKIMTDILDI